MKTLINKRNSQIRITAPEIIRWFTDFYVVKAEAGKRKGRVLVVKSKDWTLVEGEPEKIYYKMLDNKANCPFDKGNCNYCTVQFCGAREENHIETRSTAEPVDFEKQKEQKPVDLEKEIDKTVSECTSGYNFDWDRFARHFYELGLKARKEE